jgi:hypothetical protein
MRNPQLLKNAADSKYEIKPQRPWVEVHSMKQTLAFRSRKPRSITMDHRHASNFRLISTVVVTLGLVLNACDSKSKGDGSPNASETETGAPPPGTLVLDTGSVALQVAALSSAQSFDATNAADHAAAGEPGVLAISTSTLTRASYGLAVDTSTWPTFHPTSITSGAPDGFKVTIKKIVIDDPNASTTNQQSATLFEKADGVTISVDSGTTDLGELVAAAASSDGKASFKAGVGTYKRVKVTFKRKAQIKGCVTGDFNIGPDGVAAAQGVHTYCTRRGYSTFDAVTPGPTEFEGLAAEWMDFDLQGGHYGPEYADEDVELSFDVGSDIVVKKDEELDLSFVIDLNRMLRFYNQGRLDQGAGPDAPTNRAYFFTSVFTDSIFFFLGKPGRIYGYEGRAKACLYARWDAQTGACNVLAGDPGEFIVAFWMTIITAPDGSPIFTSFTPDDDTTLTVVKGSQQFLTSPSITAGSADGLVDVHYGLDQTELGKIRDFPASLEVKAVGDELTGMRFEAQQSSTCGDSCKYQGQVYAARRL